MKFVEKATIPRGSEKVCPLTGESPRHALPKKLPLKQSSFLGSHEESHAFGDLWFCKNVLYVNYGGGSMYEQDVKYLLDYVRSRGKLSYPTTHWLYVATMRAYKLGLIPDDDTVVRSVLDDAFYPTEGAT